MDDEPRDARKPDRGSTLVEVVVAITLMAIIVVPMLISTATLIKASDTSRTSAETERVIQDAADRVTRSDLGCSYEAAVDAAVRSRGWDASRATASYQHLIPGADAATQGAWAPANPGASVSDACPAGQRTTRLIQLVTITIVDEAGRNRSIQVVKSDD